MGITKMTIKEKIGQMFCLAYHGTEVNDQLLYLVKKMKVGGLISFARNIESPRQIFSLNNKLQAISDMPLFLGLDQEGGSVKRIMSGITPLPGAMTLTAATDEKEVYEISKIVGKELRELGFNLNFAPVADINNNPLNPVINSRSYSDNPQVVYEYSIAAAKGFQDALILPTMKHFPGHGDTKVDSHIGLPVVNKTKDELYQIEIYPFKLSIASGLDGVMLSHVLYSELDNNYPASLSNKIIKGILKEELGFDGLIVTDSLTMGAISKEFTKEEVILNAVNAGVDLLIFCGKADLNDQIELFNTFVKLVVEGKIPLARIDESVRKILYFKQKYDINKINKSWDEVVINLAKEESMCLSEKIYDNSITLVSDFEYSSLQGKKNLILFPEISVYTLVDNESKEPFTLGMFLEYDEIIYNNGSNISDIITKTLSYDTIILCTYNIASESVASEIYSQLNKDKVIVASLRSPYDYLYLQDVRYYFCCYEPTPEALKSLARVIKGDKKPSGKLPIKL